MKSCNYLPLTLTFSDKVKDTITCVKINTLQYMCTKCLVDNPMQTAKTKKALQSVWVFTLFASVSSECTKSTKNLKGSPLVYILLDFIYLVLRRHINVKICCNLNLLLKVINTPTILLCHMN